MAVGESSHKTVYLFFNSQMNPFALHDLIEERKDKTISLHPGPYIPRINSGTKRSSILSEVHEDMKQDIKSNPNISPSLIQFYNQSPRGIDYCIELDSSPDLDFLVEKAENTLEYIRKHEESPLEGKQHSLITYRNDEGSVKYLGKPQYSHEMD